MINILVSVIIPVYNGEDYILECILSVVNQDYKNLEIIIIDDGSLDRTINIVENLLHRDGRVKVIRQSHEGVSSARNKGIELSTGKYLVFLDSDDVILPSFVSTLLKSIDGFSFVGCGFYVSTDIKEKTKVIQFDENEMLSDSYLRLPYCHLACWAYLFDREFIIRNNILFDKALTMSEDALFMLSCFEKIKSISLVKDVLYWHRINPKSVCGTVWSLQKIVSMATAEYKILTTLHLSHAARNICRNMELNYLTGVHEISYNPKEIIQLSNIIIKIFKIKDFNKYDYLIEYVYNLFKSYLKSFIKLCK